MTTAAWICVGIIAYFAALVALIGAWRAVKGRGWPERERRHGGFCPTCGDPLPPDHLCVTVEAPPPAYRRTYCSKECAPALGPFP